MLRFNRMSDNPPTVPKMFEDGYADSIVAIVNRYADEEEDKNEWFIGRWGKREDGGIYLDNGVNQIGEYFILAYATLTPELAEEITKEIKNV